MKFAIFLQNYFPYGGLQRDAVRLAEASMKAGDEPTLVVSTWDGPKPDGIRITELACGGRSNHSKVSRFAAACKEIINSGTYDTSISFSRVPGAPFYFCGDACFLEKFQTSKKSIMRLLPRYRFFLDNEKELFDPATGTHTFFLSQQEVDTYKGHYSISQESHSILPPWLSPPRTFDLSREQIRQSVFDDLGLSPDSQLLLFAGSNYALKRLDTLIEAVAQLAPHIHLAVCGQDDLEPPRKLAESLDIANRVHLMGAQDNMPKWMTAADLLVQPSQRETAGMVLVEALSYGLPVTCTQLCGYAPHVKDAGGTVLSQRCPPSEIATTVNAMLSALASLRIQALDWAKKPEHFRTAEHILQSMRDSLDIQR
jgi:UDP-glucose:(heptosyl)LPS alpha-1,3-glucosyltransferase